MHVYGLPNTTYFIVNVKYCHFYFASVQFRQNPYVKTIRP